MTVHKILDEMDILLQDSSRVPFTNKVIVEEEELARLIDELRDALPNEIMEANRIMSERKRIMEDVQKEAQTIVDQAQNYVSRMTDDASIKQQAQEQADVIIQQAKDRAQGFENEAVQYAEEVFKYLEANLAKVLESIQQGRDNLKRQTK